MDEWTWEFKEQAWYHKPCDVYVPGDATDQRCLICRQRHLSAWALEEAKDAVLYYQSEKETGHTV